MSDSFLKGADDGDFGKASALLTRWLDYFYKGYMGRGINKKTPVQNVLRFCKLCAKNA